MRNDQALVVISIVESLEKIINRSSFGRITQLPFFLGLLLVTITAPALATWLFWAAESGANQSLSSFATVIDWYINTLPFIGRGNPMPATTIGYVIGILIHLGNFLLFSVWFGLLCWRLFARMAMRTALQAIRQELLSMTQRDQ